MNSDYPLERNIAWSRRKFLRRSILTSLAGYLGAGIVHGANLSDEFLISLFRSLPKVPGKHKDLIILNDRPWNIETPAHLLDEKVTSADRLFVRNNGLVPQDVDPEKWSLEISGESVVKPQTFTLNQLKTEFDHHTLQLTIECAGNGRAEFNPPASGNQWTIGAVGAPKWTGVRLKDVLKRAGLKPDAVYIGYYGKDIHLTGNLQQVVISRGVPIHKAQENESLIAWAMNRQDLPLMHGYPLRLVFGGWPASTSGKWLHKIAVRNRVHDGPKMEGQSYRVPCSPVAPGSEVANEDMCIIESMPVKSIITYPRSGAVIKPGRVLEFGGHAWAGDQTVSSMEYSLDFGISWHDLHLDPPHNRLAWQHWRGTANFPDKGYYELWVRATDSQHNLQPMVLPGWNPRGYLNNACHRIAIKVA